MRTNRIVLGILLLLLGAAPALAQTAAGRESTAPRGYWMPQGVSTFSGVVDFMFDYILWLTLAINVAVFVAMIAFLIKYRYKPGRHATFIHGNNKLETVWTLVPTLILALTAVFSQTSWSNMKMPPAAMLQDKNTVELEVVAQQFAWNFHYPGKDGKLGPRKRSLVKTNGSPDEQIGLDREHGASKDDFVLQRMVVPVNRPVYLHLTSRDVIHSFFLPDLRVKQDAMPGLNARVWFQAEKTSAEAIGRDAAGEPKPFDIVCAELCGQGHFQMRGQMFVVSDEEYQKFLDAENAAIEASGGEEAY